MKIPNYAYTTLSQNLISCSTLSKGYCLTDWLILENNQKAALNVKLPYWICFPLLSCHFIVNCVLKLSQTELCNDFFLFRIFSAVDSQLIVGGMTWMLYGHVRHKISTIPQTVGDLLHMSVFKSCIMWYWVANTYIALHSS